MDIIVILVSAGAKQDIQVLHTSNAYYITRFVNLLGVATFCKTEFTPVAAEEGITGVLKCTDAVCCYPIQSDIPNELLQEIDAGE